MSFTQATAFTCKDQPMIVPHIHGYVNHEINTQMSNHLTVQQYIMFCKNTIYEVCQHIRIHNNHLQDT